MDKVRLALVLITIAITVGPILGIVLAYRDNLPGLVVPPELDQIMNDLDNDFANPTQPGGSGNDIFPQPLSPEDIQYDPASRTFTFTTSFKNPLPLDLNSMSGNLECDEHRFALGTISLKSPSKIKAGETVTASFTGQWSETALNHFEAEHAGEQSIAGSLVDATINAGGMTVQLSDRISLGEIPIIT